MLMCNTFTQVYKAQTFEGENVAVKVQYSDLQSRFKSDVSTVDFLLKIIGVMHPDFGFAWVLGYMEKKLKQELDFVNEGRNSERCSKHLGMFKYIYVPKVFWDYTSTVLTLA